MYQKVEPRLLLAILLTVVAAACSDDTSQNGNDGGWIDPNPDAQYDADTQYDADAGGPDAEDDIFVPSDADLPDGGGQVQVRGWYATSFEQSLFVPDDSLDGPQWDNNCRSTLGEDARDAGLEWWWANGIPLANTLAMFPPTINPQNSPRIALLDATGEVSGLGEHGHMGAYDRDFDVSSSTLDVCETARAAGHCAVPPAFEFCLQGVGDLSDERLVREVPGAQPTDPAPQTYTLTFTPPDADFERVRLHFEMPEDPSMAPAHVPVFTVDELPTLTIERQVSQSGPSVLYNADVSGWVGKDITMESESIWVSIQAMGPADRTLHVWGHFAVDEVIAYP